MQKKKGPSWRRQTEKLMQAKAFDLHTQILNYMESYRMFQDCIKVIHPKLYKKDAYAALVYFDPKKYTARQNCAILSLFNVLVQIL